MEKSQLQNINIIQPAREEKKRANCKILIIINADPHDKLQADAHNSDNTIILCLRGQFR